MRLSFYYIDEEYVEYLRKFDRRVSIINKHDGSKLRPMIGVILDIEGQKFYAPLASPKQKHLMMKDAEDFIKIDGGKYGAINLNNMIPVKDNYVKNLDISNCPTTTKDEVAYKNLLINELTWCNILTNKNKIQKKAEHLLLLIRKGRCRSELIERCCDFDLLMLKHDEYK